MEKSPIYLPIKDLNNRQIVDVAVPVSSNRMTLMAQLPFKGPAKLAGISEFVMAQLLIVPEGQAGVAKRCIFSYANLRSNPRE